MYRKIIFVLITIFVGFCFSSQLYSQNNQKELISQKGLIKLDKITAFYVSSYVSSYYNSIYHNVINVKLLNDNVKKICYKITIYDKSLQSYITHFIGFIINKELSDNLNFEININNNIIKFDNFLDEPSENDIEYFKSILPEIMNKKQVYKNSLHQYFINCIYRKYFNGGKSILESSITSQRVQPDELDILVGASAISESLQSEIILDVSDDENNNLIHSISELTGPQQEMLPFKEMIGNKKSKYSSIAKIVPEDQYYVYFSRLSAVLELIDNFNVMGGNLYKFYETILEQQNLEKKYLKQLGIDLKNLFNKLGDAVIGDIVFTGGDIFFSEGTDINIIMEIKNKILFEKFINEQQSIIIKEFPASTYQNAHYKNFDYEFILTQNRRVSSYFTIIGDYAIFSNSYNGITRIIDTIENDIPSIAKSLDFQYMRTIYKFEDKKDVFIFLSDPFIRRMVSPLVKIAESRRNRCFTTMKIIKHSMIIANLLGNNIENLDELIESKFIYPEYLKYPSEGEYSIKNGEIYHSIYGNYHFLTPITELKINKISENEKEAYIEFLDNYNSYWGNYFDPIGIRITLDKKMHIETHILPLIQNSIYDEVKDFVGYEKMKIYLNQFLEDEILRFDVKLSENILDWLSSPDFTKGELTIGLLDFEQSIIYDDIFNNLRAYAILDITDKDSALEFFSFLGEEYKENEINYFYDSSLPLYFIFIEGYLLVGTHRDIVERLITYYKSNKKQIQDNAGISLKYFKDGIDKSIAYINSIIIEFNNEILRQQIDKFEPYLEFFDEDSFFDDFENYAGYIPVCPDGELMQINDSGNLECPLKKLPQNPVLKNLFLNNELLSPLKYINQLNIAFSFTEEGIETVFDIDTDNFVSYKKNRENFVNKIDLEIKILITGIIIIAAIFLFLGEKTKMKYN